jgi:hypothetical protein
MMLPNIVVAAEVGAISRLTGNGTGAGTENSDW